MYSTCLYCNSPLGLNESVEAMPVGRSLAFDSSRGRLWAVCTRCHRWNLSPLGERLEAIDQCERLFRTTPLRASTDQIGLAKVREGLELVRIGQPSKPELATWRYARVFERRRRISYAVATAIGGVGIAIVSLNQLNPVLYSAIPALGSLPSLVNVWHLYWQYGKAIARVRTDDGSLAVVRGGHMSGSYLEPSGDASGWCLHVAHKGGHTVLHEAEAERTLGRMLAFTNRVGGSKAVVMDAAQQLVNAGSAAAYLKRMARRTGSGATSLEKQLPGAESRLALEMALHEDTERVALEGELAPLRQAWQEAEELAAIADTLLVPDWARTRPSKLKAGDS